MPDAARTRARPRRRPASLFVQLLALQLGLTVLVMLVFGALFYAERNRALASLQGELWAPVLQQALRMPEGSLPSQVLATQRERPAQALWLSFGGPRIAALRDTLRSHGLPVRDLAFARNPHPGDGALVWLALDDPHGGTRWYAMSGRLVEGAWPARLVVALGIASMLLVGASWVFTRRLTQPLSRLHRRMQRAAPGALGEAALDSAFDPAAGAAVPAGTPRELLEIDAAHRALMRRLSEHERERALLLAGVSHDLRSPLARIRMAAELLPEAEGVASRRASIVRNAEVADRLVGSFLDHVRAGELPLDQPVDLVALAREAVQARGLPADTLRLEAPASLVLPRAHPQLLERVIANLLDNAFTHGAPPVLLRLALASAADGRPHEARQEALQEALLEVEDAGTGIAPDERDLALRAFGRGDASRSRPGTGLGLAVVRQVVERLGGRLEWIEAPRAGVRLRLPLADRR